MAMAASLSSNWAALLKKQSKIESKELKKKRKLNSSTEKDSATSKKKRKTNKPKTDGTIAREVASKATNIEQKYTKKDSKLLEWAADNDISLGDLEQAYGRDKVRDSLASASKSVTAELFANIGAQDKTSDSTAITRKWWNRPIEIDESKTTIGKYVALDCEFVGVGPEGKRSALARVSMVNYYGALVMDEFVRPEEKVTDWRTWVSGIRPKDMQDGELALFEERMQKFF